MEGIFTLPYSEYAVISETQKYFKKKMGFAIFIPTSRQQKGIDFIILNTLNKKILRIQVKSSRAYSDLSKTDDEEYQWHLWFNNFYKRYKVNEADVYLLFGNYPIYANSNRITSKEKFWETIILAFTDSEMNSLLKNVKQIKDPNKPDEFFGFSFNNTSKIIGDRGFSEKPKPDFSNHLLDKKTEEFLNKLK